jgi:hypothetical protein
MELRILIVRSIDKTNKNQKEGVFKMVKEFILKKVYGIELLKVSDLVTDLYKKQVKNNKKTSEKQVVLKLNRNWLLGTIVKNNDMIEIRRYGNLEITYNKANKEIERIWNNRNTKKKHLINQIERARLNQIMGIKDDKKEGVA